MRHSIWPLSAVAIVFMSRGASASPPYPAVVQQQWSLPTTPACTLCHATDSGGTGTVVTYFGRQMQAFGVRAEDESSLIDALARDKAQQTDSDGDGIPDFDALAAAKSPNSGPGPKAGGPPAPEWGCAIADTPAANAASERGSSWIFVFALALFARRAKARPPVSMFDD